MHQTLSKQPCLRPQHGLRPSFQRNQPPSQSYLRLLPPRKSNRDLKLKLQRVPRSSSLNQRPIDGPLNLLAMNRAILSKPLFLQTRCLRAPDMFSATLHRAIRGLLLSSNLHEESHLDSLSNNAGSPKTNNQSPISRPRLLPGARSRAYHPVPTPLLLASRRSVLNRP